MGTLPVEELTPASLVDTFTGDIRLVFGEDLGDAPEAYEQGINLAERGSHITVNDALESAKYYSDDKAKLALALGFVARRSEMGESNV